MKYYFSLQQLRLERKLREVGISPLLGMLGVGIIFVIFSTFLFSRTEYAAGIYLLFAIGLLISLGQKEYDSLLRQIFSKKEYLRIRIIENGIALIPFLIYLIFERQFIASLTLIPIGIVFSFWKPRPAPVFVLPTPFKKFPFEFIIGFRKTIWFILMDLLLMIQAFRVDNFNLAIFSFGLLFFTAMSFYIKPEKAYFVWINNRKTKVFLLEKFKVALICMILLCIIPYTALVFIYPENFFITTLVLLLGLLFLCSVILAKYSAFPFEMNLPQALLYGVSLWFPPMLFIVMIIFYRQSKRNLDRILE